MTSKDLTERRDEYYDESEKQQKTTINVRITRIVKTTSNEKLPFKIATYISHCA